jgi:hypothetical protein
MQARALIGRLADAWRALGRDERLAALTSLGLFVTMLLPWYSKTVIVRTRGGGTGTQSLNAFQAFSFVEAAVLLVSAGVLALLFARAEEREFHLPGGDGTIVMIAGAWTALLIFYRMLDQPSLHGNEKLVSSVGVKWGIFIALLVALGLSYVGKRIRAAEHEPPLRRSPEDRSPEAEPARPRQTVADPDFYQDHGSRRASAEREQPAGATRPVPARRPSEQRAADRAETEPSPQRRARPRFPPAPGSASGSGSGQMSFEDTPLGEE